MSDTQETSPIEIVTDLVHPQIRELSAYQTVPFTGSVKLDAMESPYGIPQSLISQLQKLLGSIDVNRYPDPDAVGLKQRLRDVFQISDSHLITLGNGSDELLQIIQLLVGGYGRTILAPQPSFSMYEIIARYTRAEYIGVDLNAGFDLPESKWLEAVEKHQPACVFFAYPNNPTGNFFDPALIEKTAEMIDGMVISDEAYFAYSGRSLLPAMERHENLAIVRTLSKSGLAGLRLGYMISHPVWAVELEKLRMPYNVGVLNQACATFALDHWDEICGSIDSVLSERKRLSVALSSFKELLIYPSETNFITVQVTGTTAMQVFDGLKDRGVLIRKLSGMHPMLENYLRISVGAPKENDAMLSALTEVLSG